MAAWFKRWLPIIAFLFTAGTAIAGGLMKGALAETEKKVAVLEQRQQGSEKIRQEDKERMERIEETVRRTEDKLDRVLDKLTEDRRNHP